MVLFLNVFKLAHMNLEQKFSLKTINNAQLTNNSIRRRKKFWKLRRKVSPYLRLKFLLLQITTKKGNLSLERNAYSMTIRTRSDVRGGWERIAGLLILGLPVGVCIRQSGLKCTLITKIAKRKATRWNKWETWSRFSLWCFAIDVYTPESRQIDASSIYQLEDIVYLVKVRLEPEQRTGNRRYIFLFPSTRDSRSSRGLRKMLRSPRLAHKAPSAG